MARQQDLWMEEDPVARSAAAAFQRTVRAGAIAYRRDLHLPRLIAVLPSEVADRSPAMGRALLRRIARALRSERNRGRSGHWTYDLNRHIGLCQAYAAERQSLRGQESPPLRINGNGRAV